MKSLEKVASAGRKPQATALKPREITSGMGKLGCEISKESEAEWKRRGIYNMSTCPHHDRREPWQDRIAAGLPAFSVGKHVAGFSLAEIAQGQLRWVNRSVIAWQNYLLDSLP